MKVVLTESQYRMILLEGTNNSDKLKEYMTNCQLKSAEVDKIYSKVIGSGMDEIINGNPSIIELSRELEGIDRVVFKENNGILQLLQNNYFADYEEEYDLYMRIEGMIEKSFKGVSEKIDSLTIMLNHLGNLQNDIIEHGLREAFNNVRPLEI